MQYRSGCDGEPISILGYGCMRFSHKGGSVDYQKTEAEVMRAIELGINYFDTAYIYGGSEEALGRILESNGCRNKVRIATKLPQFVVRKAASINKIFEEELERLRTDHIDYYLMHMVTDVEQWRNLCNLGIEDWIAQKKASGQIRHVGFSFHGSTELFGQVLDAYDWDFCQIQYNYVDEHTQAGRRGLEAAALKGLPVFIMEPLRGGKLVNDLPATAREAFSQSGRAWSPAEWALRWLWDQPEVTCVLSGMNSLPMLEENCRIASEAAVGEFGEPDLEVLGTVREAIRSTQRVGCTGCGYCMPCPAGVDIPALFRCYNRMYVEGKYAGRFEYLQTVSLRSKKPFARQCVGCGACERKCPQGIKIREQIRVADRELRPLPWRMAGDLGRAFAVKR